MERFPNMSHLVEFDREGFAAHLRQHRAQHQLTQTYLAGECGMTRQALSRLENAKREPSTAEFYGLLRIMGRTAHWQDYYFISNELIDLESQFNYGFVGELENVG